MALQLSPFDADMNHHTVSMVDGALFDTLNKIAQILRKKQKDRPFGGIQVSAYLGSDSG